MIDLDALDERCPKCNGLGRTENPTWFEFWDKDFFRTLGTQEKLSIVEEMTPDQPDEPIFFICKECHGRGKILTAEGKQLVEFIRFWLNPNY
ncbi:hypothetical protein [Desulfosporosinus sp. OT]|uniref:hypothetical protein n=1 Tax=Desulfosporosinus sp. OT TaxID=913865 RepID=UPI0002239E3C|nr:hypothetical protein [Desulfosporosinus sp. OT]EGW39363.1 hypothetical protein DOT_2648 [Desulfosporosinus sp. OT]